MSTLRTYMLTAAMTVLLLSAGALMHQGTEQATVTPPSPTAVKPARLKIPALELDVPVTDVGLTVTGGMDVPRDPMVAGWFRHGYRPGTPGNAVIAGHVDTPTGAPAIFARLDRLKPGDEIVVENGSGAGKTFRVVSSETFHVKRSPMERIFGPADDARLNLITCAGNWSKTYGTYEHRLVVFAEAI